MAEPGFSSSVLASCTPRDSVTTVREFREIPNFIVTATGHLRRLVFGRPWRKTEVLLRSITALLGIDVGAPDHTTLSRRSPGLALATSLAQAQAQASGPMQRSPHGLLKIAR